MALTDTAIRNTVERCLSVPASVRYGVILASGRNVPRTVI